MLDLIIPVYKNIPGLYRTLFSIGTELNKRIFVTIVDDCSGDNYDEVIQFFQKFFPIRVIYLPENRGPGVARQEGLNRATQQFVSFIDCGDTYITPTKLKECLNFAEQNSHFYMFSWAHVEEKIDFETGEFFYNDVGPQHNRMHGKIYNREFIMKNNIRFCEESSRANEDIGFNISARIIACNNARRDNCDRIYNDMNPAVVWKSTGPSIVRSDNCAFYYRDQNMGMALNGEHILNTVKAQNVDEDLIIEEVYEEMAHMYIFYIASKNGRPEFVDKAIEGALRYYVNCFKPYGQRDPRWLREIYWNTVNNFLADPTDPIRMDFTALDFPGFLNMLEERAANNNAMSCNSSESTNCICENGFSYIAP